MRDFTAILDTTWPAAANRRAGPFVVRVGEGGGRRVSAATACGAWSGGNIAAVEDLQQTLGQPPLFMLREGEDALDTVLAERGYGVIDPVVIWEAPVSAFAATETAAEVLWPPDAGCAALWAAGGIGPARLAVMRRAPGPKCVVRAGSGNTPAGVAFLATEGRSSMLHALHVAPEHRRCGVARAIMAKAAEWSGAQGATHLCLAVTRANRPANALYASLGMAIVGQYHYREKPLVPR